MEIKSKVPDTVIGILEKSGNFVSISPDGKMTVDGTQVDSKNVKMTMAAKRGQPWFVEPEYIMNPGALNPKPIDYQQQVKDLKEFLTFKGFQLDENELKDFVESRRLADKMIEESKLKEPNTLNWVIHEYVGSAYANVNAIAKVKL